MTVRAYLLDASVLAAYLRGYAGAAQLARAWIVGGEAATSIVVSGEIIEYFKGFPDYPRHRAALRTLLRRVPAYPLTSATLEHYADLRRAMRPPHGPGLSGIVVRLSQQQPSIIN